MVKRVIEVGLVSLALFSFSQKSKNSDLETDFDKEFPEFIKDPFGFLIRKDHKLGQVLTWEQLVHAEYLSKWERFGTGRVPVPFGTGTWYSHAACTKPVPLGQGKVKK